MSHDGERNDEPNEDFYSVSSFSSNAGESQPDPSRSSTTSTLIYQIVKGKNRIFKVPFSTNFIINDLNHGKILDIMKRTIELSETCLEGLEHIKEKLNEGQFEETIPLMNDSVVAFSQMEGIHLSYLLYI